MDSLVNFYQKYVWNNPIMKPIHKSFGMEEIPMKVYNVGEKAVDTSSKFLNFSLKLLSFEWVWYLIIGGSIVLLIIIFKK